MKIEAFTLIKLTANGVHFSTSLAQLSLPTIADSIIQNLGDGARVYRNAIWHDVVKVVCSFLGM